MAICFRSGGATDTTCKHLQLKVHLISTQHHVCEYGGAITSLPFPFFIHYTQLYLPMKFASSHNLHIPILCEKCQHKIYSHSLCSHMSACVPQLPRRSLLQECTYPMAIVMFPCGCTLILHLPVMAPSFLLFGNCVWHISSASGEAAAILPYLLINVN